MKPCVRYSAVIAFAVLSGCRSAPAPSAITIAPVPSQRPEDAFPGATGRQMLDAVFALPRHAPWDPMTAPPSRGAAGKVYSTVAPATVIVRTEHGHGSGFVIDAAKGLVISNNHVVSDGALDPQLGGIRVAIYFGTLNADGTMQLLETPERGIVLKRDPNKDLALIQLLDRPRGIEALPSLHLASKVPNIGTDVAAIGHPAAALLWSARTCEIVGIGTWPKDQIDVVIGMMVAADDRKAEIRRTLSSEPARRIVLTSCGLNPGDSGGSLVDSNGDVVGVSFGIPLADTQRNIGSDKFAYHVHLDELRDFLAEIPEKPANTPPDPWPPAHAAKLLDRDGDDRADTLAFWTAPDEMSGFMLDLDENSAVHSVKDLVSDREGRDAWDWEFAFTTGPPAVAFYDTDDNGHPDFVLVDTDSDGNAEATLRWNDSGWTLANGNGEKMFDANRFPPTMRSRAKAFLKEK